ncbi:MAG: Fe-S oxidoreductase [Gammaproteobacteria bacterium]|nr:Fe-S oxidoreductase [Gammaproteobacteria bacterium]
MATDSIKEGSLGAPTRHPLNQNEPIFWDEDDLNKELERVYDICHGCRRCVSLCNAFPTLFDLVDESKTMEVDGVEIADYSKVVDQCYLCDLCYLTKCPYVPPHEWNVDFPHLMLRAKAIKFKKGDTRLRDNLITSTDLVGKVATAPLINAAVNAANRNSTLRGLLDKTLEIHKEARLPEYARPTLRKQVANSATSQSNTPDNPKVLLFTTCYCNYNEPDVGTSVIKVLRHNGVEVSLMAREHCCGMPRLELGDFKSVTRLMEKNIPELYQKAQDGYTIIAAVPSCVLMFKQELPLMFPDDERVQTVARAFNDPFEYLFKLHKAGKLNTQFKNELGSISYHVACHQRVQNIGPKTRQILELIPGTTVNSIERCSGHDGTYGVKKETLKYANKIVQPIVRQIKQKEPDHFGSDCPIAGRHIESNLDNGKHHEHPMELLSKAYGL